MPLYRWEIIRRRKPLITRKLHDVSQVLYLPFDKDHEPYSVESYDPTQVLRLPFEDPPQEVTYDRSGYGNDGTIYGAARVIGKVRNALKFDGVDDYVEVPHSTSLYLNDSLAIATWIKPSVNLSEEFFVWKRVGDRYLYLRAHLSKAQFAIGDAVYYPAVLGTTNLLADVWYYIVGVRDTATRKLRIYVNGVLEAEEDDTTIGDIANTSPIRIGVDGLGWILWFPGIMDEVRIYNRTLSLSEIKRLMNLRGI